MSHSSPSEFENLNGHHGRNRARFSPKIPRGQWPFAMGLAVIILFAGLMVVRHRDALQSERPTAVHGFVGAKGFGFDLSTTLVPASEILAGGPPKDGIPALTTPEVIPATKAHYLADEDRVIGVNLGGQARAYPLRILNWHENVNDELGERAIAVTYCPLCDSAMVFDRRTGGQVREFGISGLLYNSNVLLFDRQKTPRDESLWSQLQMRAVAGPAARKGLKLTPLPAELTTWRDWANRHPQTTVLSQRTGHPRGYEANPYANYFKHDELMFPVDPLPPRQSGLRYKDRVVVVRIGEAMRAYPLKVIERAGDEGIMEVLDGHSLHLAYDQQSDSVRVTPSEESQESLSLLHTFWFAWHAMHPDADVYGLSTGPADVGIPAPQEADHHADN